MDITTERFRLMKRHALTISRGTITGSENVLVRIIHPDANGRPIEGWGEMAPSDVTDDTADSAVAAAASYAEVLAALAPWDLQRVEDLIAEVQSQIRSLARQKGKAERHTKLMEEKFSVQLTLARRQLDAIEERLAHHATRRETLGSDLPAAREALVGQEQAREEAARGRASVEAERTEIVRRLGTVRV